MFERSPARIAAAIKGKYKLEGNEEISITKWPTSFKYSGCITAWAIGGPAFAISWTEGNWTVR